jgi:hypothetical protein
LRETFVESAFSKTSVSIIVIHISTTGDEKEREGYEKRKSSERKKGKREIEELVKVIVL